MKKAILVFALFLTACGDGATNQNAVATQSTPAPVLMPTPVPRQSPDTDLERTFAEIAKDAKGKVGVSAVVFETGQNASLNGGERFAMQSVYKVPISMAIMSAIDAGKYRPDQDVEIRKEDFVAAGQASLLRDNFPNGTTIPLWHVIEYAISQSDGTASDVLMKMAGGPAAVQKFVNEAKLTDIVIQNTEKELGKDVKLQYQNSATPDAAVALLAELKTGTSIERERGKLIMDFMNESATGPNRLRGMLPENAYVAHKTGTSGTRDGVTAATNDIGLISLPNGNFMAIAVFVGDSSADEKTRDLIIARIAKAAWDKWGQ